MAGNPLPRNFADLNGFAEKLAGGLHALEAEIGIRQNTESVLRGFIGNCRAADTALGVALAARRAAKKNLAAADRTAKKFLHSARMVFRHHLGDRWNPQWEGTGFPTRSTAVPRRQEARLNLCGAAQAYFTSRPAQENAQFGVTAGRAETQRAALHGARAALHECDAAVAAQRKVWRGAYQALRKRVRGLLRELDQLLERNDPRWRRFGLALPAAPATPPKVRDVVLTPLGPGTMRVSWPRPPRATRHRVFAQVLGVDTEPVNVITVHDAQTILTGLPRGKILRVTIVAANETAEAQPSAAVEREIE